jgi:adenosine 3'-phospho 5'-phosphosulfate transporter B2
MKYLFCFVGLQISYVLWGITQENLMTTEYKFGRFKSSSFCVFANRLLALIVAFSIVAFRRYYHYSANNSSSASNEKNKVVKDVPFYYYAPSSLSNTLSSWAQYESLKYVSFPIQVVSKSCKIIPTMLVCVATHSSARYALAFIFFRLHLCPFDPCDLHFLLFFFRRLVGGDLTSS